MAEDNEGAGKPYLRLVHSRDSRQPDPVADVVSTLEGLGFQVKSLDEVVAMIRGGTERSES